MGLITPSGGLLFWMVLIFAIVFCILAKAGFPVITAAIRKRSDFITASLEDARKAQERLGGIQQECDDMLHKTRETQEAMLKEAKTASARIVDDAKKQAVAQAADIIAKAREEIEQMKKEALVSVRNEVVALSVAVSEKILRQNLASEQAQSELIGKMVDELKIKENERRNNS